MLINKTCKSLNLKRSFKLRKTFKDKFVLTEQTIKNLAFNVRKIKLKETKKINIKSHALPLIKTGKACR